MPRRLIEEAFPLKKVSTDSKHEKECTPRTYLHASHLARPPSARRLSRRDDSHVVARSRRCP